MLLRQVAICQEQWLEVSKIIFVEINLGETNGTLKDFNIVID